MAVAQYFVERLTANNEVWMIKFGDEEYGSYKSQSEAVLFAIDAAEKLNEHGEKAQVTTPSPDRSSTNSSGTMNPATWSRTPLSDMSITTQSCARMPTPSLIFAAR